MTLVPIVLAGRHPNRTIYTVIKVVLNGGLTNKKQLRRLQLLRNHMALTKEDVDKLKVVHEQETGEKLTDEEAWEIATRLLELTYVLTGTCIDKNPSREFDST